MITWDFSKPDPNVETHHCHSRLEGDWIVFTCTKCKDYERRYNFKTKEMKVKNSSLHINHQGQYVPPILEGVQEN